MIHGRDEYPDGGACHHACANDAPCWRLKSCVPLSASGLTDEWKVPQKETICSTADRINQRHRLIVQTAATILAGVHANPTLANRYADNGVTMARRAAEDLVDQVVPK